MRGISFKRRGIKEPRNSKSSVTASRSIKAKFYGRLCVQSTVGNIFIPTMDYEVDIANSILKIRKLRSSEFKGPKRIAF